MTQGPPEIHASTSMEYVLHRGPPEIHERGANARVTGNTITSIAIPHRVGNR